MTIHPERHAAALEAVRAKQNVGMPIASALTAPLKSWLGIDPSTVRIHTDRFASAAAAALHANAFTVGQDIFFGAGQYDPMRPAGGEAHRLITPDDLRKA